MKIYFLFSLIISCVNSYHIPDISFIHHTANSLNNLHLLSHVNDIKNVDLVSKTNPGIIVVKQISSILPKVDSIGHNILHANNEFISDIFDNKLIPDKYKKDIILLSVRLAQYGDDMGSEILQLYYNIIDFCL